MYIQLVIPYCNNYLQCLITTKNFQLFMAHTNLKATFSKEITQVLFKDSFQESSKRNDMSAS